MACAPEQIRNPLTALAPLDSTGYKDAAREWFVRSGRDAGIH